MERENFETQQGQGNHDPFALLLDLVSEATPPPPPPPPPPARQSLCSGGQTRPSGRNGIYVASESPTLSGVWSAPGLRGAGARRVASPSQRGAGPSYYPLGYPGTRVTASRCVDSVSERPAGLRSELVGSSGASASLPLPMRPRPPTEARSPKPASLCCLSPGCQAVGCCQILSGCQTGAQNPDKKSAVREPWARRRRDRCNGGRGGVHRQAP